VDDNKLKALEGKDFVDKATWNLFVQFLEPAVLLAEKALSYF